MAGAGADAAKRRIKQLREYIKLMPDNASAGKLFSEFRARVLGKGELSHIKNVPGKPPTVPGTKRKADGLANVLRATEGGGGPAPGRYALEDKAGESFNLEQAERYAKAMKDGWPGIDGVMYIVENEQNAIKIARKLKGLARKLKGLDGGKFVIGYFDDGGVLKWK